MAGSLPIAPWTSPSSRIQHGLASGPLHVLFFCLDLSPRYPTAAPLLLHSTFKRNFLGEAFPTLRRHPLSPFPCRACVSLASPPGVAAPQDRDFCLPRSLLGPQTLQQRLATRRAQ